VQNHQLFFAQKQENFERALGIEKALPALQ
jgi:hypothetical protein